MPIIILTNPFMLKYYPSLKIDFLHLKKKSTKLKQNPLQRYRYCYSVATAGSLNEECLTEGEVSQACMEYGEKLDELSQLVNQQKPQVEKMRGLATELQKIKLAVAPSQPASDSPELRAALKEAQEASKKYGPTSPEAKSAWEDVEEIASSGVNNALGGMLDDECLVEAMEACEALDELNRALNLNKAGDDRFSG